jgi:DNA helicase-2/ATP-dependent DNA helicase PcrA
VQDTGLEAYAVHLSETFTEEELRDGTFTTIGAVHRPGTDDNVPSFVRHCWPEYDHELTSAEPKPATFFQYVTAGRKTTFETGEAYQAVEKIAEGIIRLARLANAAARLAARRRKHAQILEELEEQSDLRQRYRALVTTFANPETDLPADKWDGEWCGKVIAIAGALAGTAFVRSKYADFLAWPVAAQAGNKSRSRAAITSSAIPRMLRYLQFVSARCTRSRARRTQPPWCSTPTFTAITCRNSNLGCLARTRQRGARESRMQARLKQHYVRMTRPMHLLCLAMKDTFTPQEIETLKARAWRVARHRTSRYRVALGSRAGDGIFSFPCRNSRRCVSRA